MNGQPSVSCTFGGDAQQTGCSDDYHGLMRVNLLQVRFGVLNAGNFGVSQSRKRTFIWGVAPGSALPEWPRPQHVFRSPQLTIKLPGGAEVQPFPLSSSACLIQKLSCSCSSNFVLI